MNSCFVAMVAVLVLVLVDRRVGRRAVGGWFWKRDRDLGSMMLDWLEGEGLDWDLCTVDGYGV